MVSQHFIVFPPRHLRTAASACSARRMSPRSTPSETLRIKSAPASGRYERTRSRFCRRTILMRCRRRCRRCRLVGGFSSRQRVLRPAGGRPPRLHIGAWRQTSQLDARNVRHTPRLSSAAPAAPRRWRGGRHAGPRPAAGSPHNHEAPDKTCAESCEWLSMRCRATTFPCRKAASAVTN